MGLSVLPTNLEKSRETVEAQCSNPSVSRLIRSDWRLALVAVCDKYIQTDEMLKAGAPWIIIDLSGQGGSEAKE